MSKTGMLALHNNMLYDVVVSVCREALHAEHDESCMLNTQDLCTAETVQLREAAKV